MARSSDPRRRPDAKGRSEIEKFFVATDELEDEQLKFLGWKGPKVGDKLIEGAAKAFRKANGKT
jgi:hypothetical protein